MNTLNKAINDINVNAKSFRMVIDDKNQFEPDMKYISYPTHDLPNTLSTHQKLMDSLSGWSAPAIFMVEILLEKYSK